MKKIILHNYFVYLVTSLVVTILTVSSAHSALVSVSGALSNVGAPAAIISAPALINNLAVSNLGQQGFDEKQNVLLGANLAVDAGIIAAGMRVDSHMIFFNRVRGSAAVNHFGVNWVFNGNILGVMSDNGGLLEAASNGVLGAAGTLYPGAFSNRGLESLTDSYTILGNILNVGMHVTSPGDWIRVVTLSSGVSPIPLPAALPLYGAGLAVLGLIGWRRKRKIASAFRYT